MKNSDINTCDLILSIIGLGKLGSPMAAVFASKGFKVIGVDTDQVKVDKINNGIAPVNETHLTAAISEGCNNLTATTSINDAVSASDVTFIIVPTPSNADGEFSLDYMLAACEAVGKALRESDKDHYHLVCVCSTVMPGATGGDIRNILEKTSGRTVGVTLGLCYSPEFIALGSVIHDFLHPDFLLIGQSDIKAGDILETVYRNTLENKPVFARMNFVNAEIAKIAVNSFVTMKITYANMLAGICQNIVGADVDVVTNALGLDSRIGKKYLKGAVGFGGPCFPRDNVALAQFASRIGARADLAQTVHKVNLQEIDRIIELIKPAVDDEICKSEDNMVNVGILGLAYKPDTDVVEQSQGIMLAQVLQNHNSCYNVSVYDPVATDNARKILGDNIKYCKTLEDCIKTSSVIIIMTPWHEFKNLPTVLQAAIGNAPEHKRIIVDCWRMLDMAELSLCRLQDKIILKRVGVGASEVGCCESSTGLNICNS